MALITYLARVHFADGVLEDALWSELEARRRKRPLFVVKREGLVADTIERLFASLPVRTGAIAHDDVPPVPTHRHALKLARAFRDEGCDALVAFGSAAAINLAKLARLALALDDGLTGGLSRAADGGGRLEPGTALPDLIAIPGIGGFGAALSADTPMLLDGVATTVRSREIIPRVTICDPTLTLDATVEETAAAAAEAVGQCMEAFLSRGYNPPAEGIALDGLRRAMRHWERVLRNERDLEARREMMAASLNGALAVQKGLGASHASSAALGSVSDRALSSGTLKRITLPEVLRYNREAAVEKFRVLETMLDLTNREADEGVERVFATMPLPTKLSELGLSALQLERAAVVAAEDMASGTNPRAMDAGDYLSLMRSLH